MYVHSRRLTLEDLNGRWDFNILFYSLFLVFNATPLF